MADDPDPKGDPAKGDPDPKKDPDKPLGDGGEKALAAERKARRDAEAALKDVQTKLQELEDKDKDEVTKLRDEVTSLRSQLTEAGAKSLRADVAMAKGLTAAQAKRLVGSTIEELEADADEILEAFPVKAGATPPPGRKPATDLKGGSDPEEGPIETNPAKLAESVPRL
jgi:hypothetical protein